MKPYYAEYVNHILRFYSRKKTHSGFKNDVDKMNYTAADRVVSKLTEDEQTAIRFIFSQKSMSVADNIFAYARQCGGDTKKLWSLVSVVTSKIAKERKLL